VGWDHDPAIIYFDRDGVLNEMELGTYVNSPEDVKATPKAGEALRLAMGITPFVFVVSNQAGAHTHFSAQTLEQIDDELWRQIGLQPLASVYCPHAKDSGCVCRKPGTRMAEVCRDITEIVWRKPTVEFVVGDNLGRREGSDSAFAAAIGAHFAWVHAETDPARALFDVLRPFMVSASQGS